MADLSPTPARTIEEATAALDFDHPLESGDARWQDLNPARGDKVMLQLQRRFERKQGGVFLHVAFVSHRGAGKTTELLRLTHDLRGKYSSLRLEANTEMDAHRIEMEDLLLVLAQKVEEHMRSLELPLPEALLSRVSGWFAEVIQATEVGKTYAMELKSEASIGGEIPYFAKLLGRLSALQRVESKHRTAVKEVLRQYPGSLMDSLNSLLEAAHKLLKKKRGKELLIIIDNLDRYDPKVIDEMLVRGGDRFRALKVNLILTPPISLLYRPESGSVTDQFRAVIMNTVRLRERQDPYTTLTGPGPELLLKALGKRIDVDVLIPDRAVRDRLLISSAGSIRALLEIAAEATLMAERDTLSIDDVSAAVRSRRIRMRDMINVNGWMSALVYISQNKQLSQDPACLQVLFQRLAFKYNGEGWYDIHPLISELPEFQKAAADLAAAEAAP